MKKKKSKELKRDFNRLKRIKNKLIEVKNKHGQSILYSAICSVVISLYVFFTRFKGPNALSPTWAAVAIFASIFLFSFGLFMALLNYKKIKKKKLIKEMMEHKKEIISMALAIFCTIMLKLYLDPTAGWINLIIAFGTVFTLCEACAYAPTWKLQNFVEFGNNFILYFCIPFIFISIILIGAMAGKYHPQGNFLSQATDAIKNISGVIANALATGFTKAVTVLYNLGYNQPELFLYVSIAATVFLLMAVIKKTFTKPKYEENEN